MSAIALAERGLLPDLALRWGIRRLLRQRLREEEARSDTDRERWIQAMREGPIAAAPAAANAQHYELPPDLFQVFLGPRLKYSSAYWPPGVATLAAAEEAMLALTAERAGLEDGMEVLELGCGWGSLTLWIAERYPRTRVLAVSGSRPQRAHIEAALRRLGRADRVEVETADMSGFATARRFDRVVSVEMFEHMRNWEELLARIAGWLRPEGRLFTHVFCHRWHCYPFASEGDDNWMGRHFFTGGVMPADGLFARFDRHFEVERHDRVPGEHYARTAEAWLRRLDAARAEAHAVLARVHGEADAARALARWRIFFLACAELFGFRGGDEWWVAHDLLRPRPGRSVATGALAV